MTENDDLNIIAYCCEHCAYAAADLAGGLRMQYPPTIKIIQLPCTGRVDARMVLSAIEDGADGVMVAGCMPGDCHYLEGNFSAKRRVEYIRSLLSQIGLEPERVRMYNLSSAMAGRFVAITQEMNENIQSLGKNPLRNHNAPISKPESGT